MDPHISISRNICISFYSYIVFKPTLLNQFASAKDTTQSSHTEPDFEKKNCSIHALYPLQSSNKPATFLYTYPPQNDDRIVIPFKDNITYAQIQP